jgi:hypothetical protein
MLCHEHRVCDALRPDGHGSPVYFWETKLGGKRLAREQGVRFAEVLQGPLDPGDIDWDALPGEFVVKPEWGNSRDGVLVLRRSVEGDFEELLSGSPMSLDAVMRRVTSRPGQVIVEEAIALDQGPPDDWKFVTFNGRVEQVLQIRRTPSGPRFKYYDAEWSDIGSAEFGLRCDPDLPSPSCPAELMATASKLSKAAGVPFVRVDLYELQGSPVFGEMTPRPSQFHRYRYEWDVRLGRAWERAEVELAAGEPYRVRRPISAE